MTYKRKTKDEWVILGNYGYGWDELCAEDTRKDAVAQLKCYRENEPGASHAMKCKRVPIGEIDR